jgi:hypothetical protein
MCISECTQIWVELRRVKRPRRYQRRRKNVAASRRCTRPPRACLAAAAIYSSKEPKKKTFYKCMTVHDKLHRIDLFFSLIMGLATSSIRTGARRLSKEEKFNCKNARLGQTQDLDLQTQVSAPKLFFLIIQLSTLF